MRGTHTVWNALHCPAKLHGITHCVNPIKKNPIRTAQREGGILKGCYFGKTTDLTDRTDVFLGGAVLSDTF